MLKVGDKVRFSTAWLRANGNRYPAASPSTTIGVITDFASDGLHNWVVVDWGDNNLVPAFLDHTHLSKVEDGEHVSSECAS